jgi:vitamin B12 transporter
MTLKNWVFLFCLLFCQFVLAQNDSIQKLKEVIITDLLLKKFSDSHVVLKLNDSVIRRNQSSLTSVLNYNSQIYFKENGFGMVSSPSFRGTTAQQTAVIWNGININSQLNGQTDFNTISPRNFDSVDVRAGGGSTIYGSSAIGGTIHLNNSVAFKKLFKNSFFVTYGSFNSLDINYNTKFSTQKFTVDFSFARNSSDNNYPILETDLKNTNGEFQNSSYNINLGLNINKNNKIFYFGQVFDSSRNLSGTLSSISNARYLDFNTRNLLEWSSNFSRFTSRLKVAFLTEQYKYFEDKSFTGFSFGKCESVIIREDFNFQFNKKIAFDVVLDFTQNKGSGSDIFENTRQVGAIVFLVKHQILEKLQYQASTRKEITNNYNSPLLYSFGAKYDFTKKYAVRANVSKNFRIPTFNDLYWQGLGNSNLNPETAFQYEIGQDFKHNDFSFSTTLFSIAINEMIQWAPGANGLWRPNNVRNVNSKGFEFSSNYAVKICTTTISINCLYARTISVDDDLQTQLVYVPKNKFTASTSLSYKKVNANFQYLYNGQVYTSSDNMSVIE